MSILPALDTFLTDLYRTGNHRMASIKIFFMSHVSFVSGLFV